MEEQKKLTSDENKKVTLTDNSSKSNFIKVGKSTVLIKPSAIVIRSGLIIHQ